MGERAARPAGHKGEPPRIPEIPTDELRARLKRLGRALNTSANSIHHQIVRSLVLVPYSNVRVKTDVPRSVLAYVSERPEQFGGVKVEQTYLRDYPHGTLAAQILGYVGQIGPAQLEGGALPRRQAGHGRRAGRPRAHVRQVPARPARRAPHPGRRERPPDPQPAPEGLKARVRASGCGCRSTSGSRRRARTRSRGPLNPGRNAGAFLAMDPRDGQLLAMGSYPTFDPAIFTKPITQKR